ncbi:MAG: GAF domain-containing protein [Actinomycetota bacterium]|nr:GAF domain-containing protein [Actinomycetota bacterium]PLS84896.1 MAG: hypothetical protein CYG60_15480 [Actinomycetota bacterium]
MRTERAGSRRRPDANAGARGLAALRVLVVEDSEDDALLLLRELERGGFGPSHERVDTAEGMEKALDGARDEPFDIVVSDHCLPRFGAPEALELLRRRGFGTPFVVVSGKIGEEATVEMLKAGADDCVMKENLARLCHTVERSLREAEVRRERLRAEELLREEQEHYRGIFEATGDGLVITDMKGVLVDANPAFCRMHGYASREDVRGLHAKEVFVHPHHYVRYEEYIAAIKAGERFRTQAMVVRRDGTPFPVEVEGSILSYKGEPHMLGVVRDVTDRARAFELLEQRLGALVRISASLTVDRPMEDTLSVLAAGVVEASTARACSVVLMEEGTHALRMAGLRGLPEGYAEAVETSWQAGARSSAVRAFDSQRPVFVRDARRRLLSDPLYAPARRFADEVPWEALFIAPLVHRGRSLGAVSAYYAPDEEPGEDEISFLQAVADQAAVAIENARLYGSVRERTRELATLLEVSNNVASALELEPLLGLILDQLKTVVDYADCSVLMVEGEGLVMLENRGPVSRDRVLGARFPFERAREIWEELSGGGPVIIEDVLFGEDRLARVYREAIGERRLREAFAHVRSWLGVPLTLGGQVIGILAVVHDEPGHYTPRHAELAETIANQAAVAIGNARLYEKAQSAAVLEERQRLARELHDSVSQALYGIALGAKTARTLIDRDPPRAADPTDYVLSLAEAGLAEMRALIFELRPESLATEGLVAALGKQAAAVEARHGIGVRKEFPEEPDVPLPVKEAIYRVAQEALHNAVKHARAVSTGVTLALDADGGIELEVVDDGGGFDPERDFPGHLGLKSMRERTARLGGTLEVESGPGRGTRVRARIPATRETPTAE